MYSALANAINQCQAFYSCIRWTQSQPDENLKISSHCLPKEFKFYIEYPNYVTTHSSAPVVNWIIYCQSRSITFFSFFFFFRLLSINIIEHFIIVRYVMSNKHILSYSYVVWDVFMLIRHHFFSTKDVKSYHAMICNWRRQAEKKSDEHTKNLFFFRFSNIYCAICVCFDCDLKRSPAQEKIFA